MGFVIRIKPCSTNSKGLSGDNNVLLSPRIRTSIENPSKIRSTFVAK